MQPLLASNALRICTVLDLIVAPYEVNSIDRLSLRPSKSSEVVYVANYCRKILPRRYENISSHDFNVICIGDNLFFNFQIFKPFKIILIP